MAVPLLSRFPKARARPRSYPVIPPGTATHYPALAADIETVEHEVGAAFAEYDTGALRDQNRYRRQQMLIVLGSALAAGLGGVQAVFPGQRWPGLLLAVIGVALAAGTRLAKEQASLDDYLGQRVKAERLRALHFQYLAATGPYAGADRTSALRRAVIAIRAGKEPA